MPDGTVMRGQFVRALLTVILLLTSAAIAAEHHEASWIPELNRAIAQELADKKLPSFALVVVDRKGIVASVAKGTRQRGASEPVTGSTLFRTGSVGKTLTDLALLVAMEQGKVALDEDVRKYLSDFHPDNPFDVPITVRNLMTHQAGLVREPPAGNYFDDSGVSLKETVESLNGTTLIWAPGTRTKYSNAGLAVAGRVLEKVYGKSYAEVIDALVYEPAGMKTARVGLSDEVERHLARGVMWQPDGRDWDAPVFDLGMSPAGDLYASTDDMAAFMVALISGEGRVVKKKTFDLMWRPPGDPPKTEWQLDVGLGFSLNGKFQGRHKMARNGGAVYGYATELALLPEEGLGVYAVATRDLSNGTVQAIAHWALRAALAARMGDPPPPYELTPRPFTSLPAKLAGCESTSDDGRLGRYAGVYGPAHNPLTVCVKDGKLHALIEWFFLYPLTEKSEGVFEFPSFALYNYEQLRFVAGNGGGMTAVVGHGSHGARFPAVGKGLERKAR